MSTAVKICGLKSADAIGAALDAGADLLGFVIYPRSPRNVSIEEAARLVAFAREKGSATTVVLLVDPDDALIDRVVSEVRPDRIQLHGQETVSRVREVRDRTGLKLLKAVPVARSADVAAASEYLAADGSVTLLFDAKPPEHPSALPGGNGLAFDWHILDAAQAAPYALAGGLTPENVAEAIRLTKAAIVDVSSGVESRPGEKDPELIRRFLRAAKRANEASETVHAD